MQQTVLQTALLGLSGTMAPALLAPRENSKYLRVPWDFMPLHWGSNLPQNTDYMYWQNI